MTIDEILRTYPVSDPLSEEDTRAKLIDRIIHRRGWDEDRIKREVTVGGIDIINGKGRRRSDGRADYVLRVKVNPDTQPVAVAIIEAKKNTLPPGHGLSQAKGYAACKRMNVPFVFSSNGYQFVMFDSHSGITSPSQSMAEFPTPDDLRFRYEEIMGFNLENPAAKPLLVPYSGGEGSRRYYQDAAIRAVLEKFARCDIENTPKRALLSLATGAGKTFIAVNLMKRIADAGQLKRALFLCDRDELRTQGLKAFQNVFGSDAAEVKRKSDGSNQAKNARIHIATYQTLGVDSDNDDTLSFLTQHYPDNYFTHIIIDECHRSAWGKWSQVLTRNSQAAQIGLTATPRQLTNSNLTADGRADEEITANNHAYFGEPVYEYDLAQAIEDGYLAACEIVRGEVDMDEPGLTIDEIMARNPVDATNGQPMSREEVQEYYSKHEYERRILLPDRIQAMCQDLFNHLLATGGPEQKTIIFCVRDWHAQEVADKMGNLYARWCMEHNREQLQPYAFKCTAAANGNLELPDLRAQSRSHFIATTVELLTTGVDVPCVRNIVFFKYLRSPISFYQMVGRGTRIDVATDKLMFRVYDYTDATQLFGEEFITRPPKSGGSDTPGPETPIYTPVLRVEGFEVHVTEAGHLVVAERDGKAMPIPVEEYREQLCARLVAQAKNLEEFRTCWIDRPCRRELMDLLIGAGYSPSVLRMVDGKADYDLYDVLGELGWGLNARTRHDRALAFRFKHEDWLNGLPAATNATLLAIADQFTLGGTEELENRQIFQIPAVKAAGGLDALKQAGIPADLLRETKERMFAA